MGHGIPEGGRERWPQGRLTCGEGRVGQVGFWRNLREGERDLIRLGP